MSIRHRQITIDTQSLRINHLDIDHCCPCKPKNRNLNSSQKAITLAVVKRLPHILSAIISLADSDMASGDVDVRLMYNEKDQTLP